MNDLSRKKGGRPKVKIPKDQHLALTCTIVEKKIIKGKAKIANLTVSALLLELALKGKIVVKTFPKELLLFTGSLNQLGNNLNQIARKRNRDDELNAIERAELSALSKEIYKLTQEIKRCLK
ncbi:plasmid mobilization protein [Marinifilum sp. D737]|uniref:plasmid mobilization protein n=1 Tax=Marinifilum sp. D737 TaxID=2969628 RepID=UPI002274F942|nr:plasmid mobilization relaxosome protein MobC [Marinifilum sp. D737]MCY1633913.1 plasmid mobilization relaxosome protein MobC [Marinifilum sp. D737]